MTNPLRQLQALGQSVGYDTIDRAQLRSGLFGRLIDEDGITGTTANPTIFEHSISHGHAYDEQMERPIRPANEFYNVKVVPNELTASRQYKRLRMP